VVARPRAGGSAPVSYARRLGLFSGTMAVIGGIIGSGIFVTPAVVAARVGTPALALTAWALGGAVALAGAFCFAELGERSPRAGGGYVYLRDGFGGLPAFLYGWALLLVMSSGACAFVAVTFANYTAALLGVGSGGVLPLALGAIVCVTALNYVGVAPAAITQNIFTLLKLGALATLILAAFALGLHATGAMTPPATSAAAASAPSVAAVSAPVAAPTGVAGVILALGTALVPVLFTCGGWQQTNFIAEEIIEPETNLPRALVLGVVAVVAVYLLANVAYLRVLGLPGLAADAAPAADAMQRIIGPAGRMVISAGIAVSSFGFLDLVVLVTPRVFQAMAADGVFFPWLARLHPVHRTPGAAVIVMGAWAALLAATGTYGKLLDYVVFGDWIFFGATVATLFVYRSRDAGDPNRPRLRFATPGYPIVPGLFVLAAAYVVLSSVASNPVNAGIGAGLILLGVPVFYYWKARAAC
jgi:basic amino acid/polyamine antiporter, APA family